MAWVRYDDQFYSNPKVTAAIAEDPGSISLHVLANTWSNAQKHPGHIPPQQPGMLICDRPLATKWAEILVRANLWHERGRECDECAAEYAELPEITGWVIHNAKEYRAPARDRTTPGTSSPLSEVRRAAGRIGGQVRAAKAAQANQANGASKSGNLPLAGVSPEPPPEPEPKTSPPSPPTTTAPIVPGAEGEEEVSIEDLVGEICATRPEWSPRSVFKAIDNCRPRPLTLIAAAFRIVAADMETESPGRLPKDGYWWARAATQARASPPESVEGAHVFQDDGDGRCRSPTCQMPKANRVHRTARSAP